MGRVKQTSAKASGAPQKKLRPELAKALAKKAVGGGGGVKGIKKINKKIPAKGGGLAEDDEESTPTESTAADSQTGKGAAGKGAAGKGAAGKGAAGKGATRSGATATATGNEEGHLGRQPVKKTPAWYARRYRDLAIIAGYTVRSDESNESRGIDSSRSLLSVHDAARLMKFRARSYKGAQPYPDAEMAEREAALCEGAPLGAAKAVQIYADAILRRLMLRCVRQSVDIGTKKVNTAAVHSVLRSYMARTAFTSGPINKALLRELQKKGMLLTPEAEVAAISAEEKTSQHDALGVAKEKKRAEARKANRAATKAVK